ncbi:cyclophane-forming radical SAM peptide maturase AmcB [Actinokineospora fastidiosa]|nr:cyclophane-forming radical SAM peptide maturase AmcB [Actinokineospora fastidiosa]
MSTSERDVPPVRLTTSAAVVLMQPTTLCNLDCSYCYLPERAVARRMSTAVADSVAASVRTWSRFHPVSVVWHGGEPLAVGAPYFRGLLERFAPGDEHPVTHSVQTNGTLIDDQWCELFASWPVAVTVSIDGVGEANAARADWAGQASTDRTLRGVDRLREHRIPFGLIAVVAEATPAAARELYRFACELGCVGLGVNLAEQKGVNDVPGQGASAEVTAFWRELATCWQADPHIRVRELDQAYSYLRAELAGVADARANRPLPSYPMVTWDGDVVPIGPELAGFTHPRHGAFATGNVLRTQLTELVAQAPRVPWVAEAIAGASACRDSCAYYAYCRGGQVANKYFETGRFDSTETTYCRTSKINLMEGILSHAEHS